MGMANDAQYKVHIKTHFKGVQVDLRKVRSQRARAVAKKHTLRTGRAEIPLDCAHVRTHTLGERQNYMINRM